MSKEDIRKSQQSDRITVKKKVKGKCEENSQSGKGKKEDRREGEEMRKGRSVEGTEGKGKEKKA